MQTTRLERGRYRYPEGNNLEEKQTKKERQTDNYSLNGIMSENHDPHELYEVARVAEMRSLLRRAMMITRRKTQSQDEFH